MRLVWDVGATTDVRRFFGTDILVGEAIGWIGIGVCFGGIARRLVKKGLKGDGDGDGTNKVVGRQGFG